MDRKLIYLASPYSHPDPNERKRRYDLACLAASHLMAGCEINGEKFAVFCPIAHSYGIEPLLKKSSHRFWMDQDLPILKRCEILVVLQIDGWESSRGIMEEIYFARSNGIPVEFCHLVVMEEDEENVLTGLHCTKAPIKNWDHNRFLGNPVDGLKCNCE